jgi:hypothetical protein
MSELWEILVPRRFNNGVEVPLSHHKSWDDMVRGIAGGLTILKSAKGVWESPSGELFQEEMIPVRIACSLTQIHRVIGHTIVHYDQEAVMAYRISDEVIIQHRS